MALADLKWHDFDGLAWVPVEDADLDARLRDMACKVFTGLKGRGYTLNPSWTLHPYTLNPICG